MKTIIFILFILASCKTTPPSQSKGDEFDKIFYLKKTNNPKELIPILGKPERIDTSDTDLDQYYFYMSKDQMPIKVFVNKKENKITTIALAYLVKFDAYAYLKKRFSSYKWIETALPLRPHLDYAEELFKVEIPELGMTFQYNNEDPLRQPTWIFFK